MESTIAYPKKYGRIIQHATRKNLKNYFAPTDEVLAEAHMDGTVKNPMGLNGSTGKTIPKYIQKKVKPKNHRFVSYATVLKSFP